MIGVTTPSSCAAELSLFSHAIQKRYLDLPLSDGIFEVGVIALQNKPMVFRTSEYEED